MKWEPELPEEEMIAIMVHTKLGGRPVDQVCREQGISPETLYKWWFGVSERSLVFSRLRQYVVGLKKTLWQRTTLVRKLLEPSRN